MAEERVVRIVSGNAAFVRFTQIQAVLIAVINIFATGYNLIEEFPCFNILTIERCMHVFAVIEMITAAVLQIIALQLFECMLAFQLLSPCFTGVVLSEGTKINGGYFLLVAFFAQLLIFKTKLFSAKPDTEETIFASDTVTQKHTRLAVIAVLASLQSVARETIDTVIEQLALQIIKTIDARSYMLETVPVITVFTKVCVLDEVAVFCKTRVVNIFSVFHRSRSQQIFDGDYGLQFFHLIKKWARKINIASVIAGVPAVSVPTFAAVHRSLLPRWILRYGPFFAECTRRRIEKLFIAQCEPVSLPAIRTIYRRWERIFFSCEYR